MQNIERIGSAGHWTGYDATGRAYRIRKVIVKGGKVWGWEAMHFDGYKARILTKRTLRLLSDALEQQR